MAEIQGKAIAEPVADGCYGSPDALASPTNRALHAYWQRIRGTRAMPARADLDPTDIVALLPHVLLLDVQHDPLDFRYRLIGTYAAEHTAEHTGRWMSTIAHQAPPSRLWSACQAVAETCRPIISNVPYVGDLKDFRRLEDIIMPLSNDGVSVNMLLVSVDFL